MHPLAGFKSKLQKAANVFKQENHGTLLSLTKSQIGSSQILSNLGLGLGGQSVVVRA